MSAAAGPRPFATALLALLALVALPTLAATAAAPSPAGTVSRPALTYTVTLDDLAAGRLGVRLEVRGWPEPSFRLHGVPAYLDNPLAVAEGQVVHDLAARDARGRSLVLTRGRAGPGEQPFVQVPAPQGAVTLTYDLVPRFAHGEQTDAYPIQLPFLDPERAWLYGNYVLCFPEPDTTAQRAVSAPLDIRLVLRSAPRAPLVGPPADTLRFANLYELLSLQWGHGGFQVRDLRRPGEPGPVPLALVMRDSLEFDATERAVLAARLRRLVDAVVAFFGAPAFPDAAIYCFRGEDHGTGGLEGSYVCQVHAAASADLADTTAERTAVFFEVALHEFFHTYTPIALFGREDPWFKEGVTSYYGQALGGRLGWLPPEEWRRAFAGFAELARRNPRLGGVALTDPVLWRNEYRSEEWRSLTYDRGLVVTLLLDDWIRAHAAASLDDVLRLLFRRHAHAGFSHADLLAAVRQTAGADPAPFFAAYVEGTVLPDSAAVAAALARVEAAGAFGPAAAAEP